MTALQIEEVRNARQFLIAYGVVRYRDVYGTLHEARFGYVYKAQGRHFVLKVERLRRLELAEHGLRPEVYRAPTTKPPNASPAASIHITKLPDLCSKRQPLDTSASEVYK